MGKKVTRYVHVTNPETRASLELKPGDEVPSWAKDQVTNEKAFAEDVDSGEVVALDGSGQAPAVEYKDMDKKALQEEVARRNETREEGQLIVAKSDRVGDLRKALEADDEARQAGDLNPSA